MSGESLPENQGIQRLQTTYIHDLFSFPIVKILAALIMFICTGWSNSVIGTWKTFDDETGAEKALVEVYESIGGEYKGKIIKSFRDTIPEKPLVCSNCPDEFMNKPIRDLIIIWGMKQKNNIWTGGKILDPISGKIYRAKMTLDETGKKLMVRGFIAISLFGRSQTWFRVK